MVIAERGHERTTSPSRDTVSTNTSLWSACGQCCTNDVDEHPTLRRGERDNQPPIAPISQIAKSTLRIRASTGANCRTTLE